MNKNKSIIIPEAVIASKIITLRKERVILDVHLADFYDIETRVLKQAVRRNKDRFPNDFMFELDNFEIDRVVSQNVIPSKRHFGGAVPFAFTENGVAMLSSVLNSKKAIEINIAIMRTFTLMRKAIQLDKDIILELKEIKKHLTEHDQKILSIFGYLKELEKSKKLKLEQAQRKRIGFKRSDQE